MIKKHARALFLAGFVAAYAAACALQRLVYALWIRRDGGSFPEGLPIAELKGFLFDASVCGILLLPLALLFACAPLGWAERKLPRALATVFVLVPLVTALLSIVFELFFWEEFHARYNFIAVDYLVYTHEVIRNIWESYPVVWYLAGLAGLLGLIAWRLRPPLGRALGARSPASERLGILLTAFALLALNLSLNQSRWLENDPVWAQELAKNSLYSIFSAYNTNEIDFKKFYLSLPDAEATSIAEQWLGSAHGLARDIKGAGAEKHWNVMLVGIESMSARFMDHFVERYNEPPKHITPNLDRMADEGLFFTNLYATGSRTVRGLEALNLSLPPTPGQSILRRPNADHLFTLGHVFRTRGYDTQFVYGGYAIFDNMGPWFSSNGYQIVDRASFAPGGVHFATAWGACDEDLFDESIRRADASYANGKHFFQMLMTTSNHRPYDFPEGRIDIHSHTGRDGAVKYTDFAIGRFIEEARKKPWFNDTLFVFVADHNASVAGGTEIPVLDYLIPLIIYNPSLVKARHVDALASQIDVGPTLLGLMGFSYRSWFFGQDLTHSEAGRALLGTYQQVALLEGNRLAMLEPNRRAVVQQIGEYGRVKKTEKYGSEGTLPPEVKRTVAIYQSASELFGKGMSKVNP